MLAQPEMEIKNNSHTATSSRKQRALVNVIFEKSA
jgi:hypothetical protein